MEQYHPDAHVGKPRRARKELINAQVAPTGPGE